jgi:hypothetical protein
MPASIRVETGIAAGTNYWIDRPVLRVGSDPQCEICLPTAELDPHALTLEFRDGSYRVYNRGKLPVSVAGALVQPASSGPWRTDQAVLLPGDLRLVLTVDGDPRPSPRPEPLPDDEFAEFDRLATPVVDESPPEPPPKKASGTLLQLGVIGLCLLVIGALLTRAPEEPSPVDRPTFESIVADTLGQKGEPATRAYLPRLQYAQAAIVRGNLAAARARFARLRDQLVRQRESAPEADRKDLERMMSYVEYRLSQLQ